MRIASFSRLIFLATGVCRCEAFVVRFPSTLAVPRPSAGKTSSRQEPLLLHDKTIQHGSESNQPNRPTHNLGKWAVAAALSAMVFCNPAPGLADGQTKDFRLPPVDAADRNRCVLSSSKMGQANAARDKLYDLRECKLSGSDASGYDLSGVIMSKTDVSKAKFVESYFSKGYLHDSNFDGADFSNAIVDRASFRGSSLKGTIFTNAVLTGTSFDGADVENADFSDSYIGSFDVRNLCNNPTLKGENPVTGADTRLSAG